MRKTKENGVTLIALVVMIVILLILASIGITSGRSTIESSKFNRFKTELQMMQSKVNELNQNEKNDIGNDLTDVQKNILDKEEISTIIFKNKTEEEKNEIKKGFKYVTREYINNSLELKGITQGFLINIDKRIVISYEGIYYKGVTYYMLEQVGDSVIYNVEYNNKNTSDGSFETIVTQDNDKWRIDISNIVYDGYIDKWQVRYKLKDSSYWQTSNDLTFYVKEEGMYDIKVVHGNEIELASKNVAVMQSLKDIKNQVLSTKKNKKVIDEYENIMVVPAGFKITSDADNITQGVVIEDATEGETQGNQFVWVPVGTIYTDIEKTEGNTKTIELNRYTFASDGTPTKQDDEIIENYFQELETSTENTPAKSIKDFKNSVEKNHGYYMGRYEAGKETIEDTDIVVCKNAATAWNNINQPTASTNARNMYDNTKTFESDLVNSYAWDTAIVFEETFGINSSNYANKKDANGTLKITGKSGDVQCNIYDMASNVLEWTTEYSKDSGYPCVLRGGYYYNTIYYTCMRGRNTTSYINRVIGFRPILYLQ